MQRLLNGHLIFLGLTNCQPPLCLYIIGGWRQWQHDDNNCEEASVQCVRCDTKVRYGGIRRRREAFRFSHPVTIWLWFHKKKKKKIRWCKMANWKCIRQNWSVESLLIGNKNADWCFHLQGAWSLPVFFILCLVKISYSKWPYPQFLCAYFKIPIRGLLLLMQWHRCLVCVGLLFTRWFADAPAAALCTL